MRCTYAWVIIMNHFCSTLERVTSPDTLTRTLDQPLPAQILQQKEEKELDLVYDPCFNCFYDPKSAKYYQLK